MKIGYARQSTTNQKNGLKNQISLLQKNKCEDILRGDLISG